ncbi:unannotated protein [freshwater metagenome]|uniref:Unannotated protein n=1 Tax=freshwater metagenome TaxID=449393 RepID=A0A6J7DGR9_9ZZZZ
MVGSVVVVVGSVVVVVGSVVVVVGSVVVVVVGSVVVVVGSVVVVVEEMVLDVDVVDGGVTPQSKCVSTWAPEPFALVYRCTSWMYQLPIVAADGVGTTTLPARLAGLIRTATLQISPVTLVLVVGATGTARR